VKSARLLALCGLLVGCCFALALFAASAAAIYGPPSGGLGGAEIVSVDRASDEQANAPTVEAAISANGRYVVFETRASNFFENDGGVVGPQGLEPDVEPPGTLREGGVFRYDRDTGALALVADGSEVHAEGAEAGKLIFRGAGNPSISANGRYVSFSSAQQLVPRDTNENIDVYVRDMDVPLTAERKASDAYALVSAKSGGEEPATYTAPSPVLPGENPGAEVWPGTAISADGRYVVFRTTELGASGLPKSDLPDQAGVETPPRQLFVRDLQAKTTTLVSREKKGEPEEGEPAGGAIGPASISADGSTVSWVSLNAPAQTRFLPGEVENPSQAYYLWRRWQEPAALARRVTGIADPEDPDCHEGEGINSSDPTATGPCYGPLSEPEASLAPINGADPALSEDGYTVAFLAGAALRPNITKESGLDVFLTSMRPGVTRKGGTRELTLAVSSGAQGSTPSIESLALSPDGSTIAFTSLRDSFVLSEPQPIGAFRPLPTVGDLYVINLAANTLERAVVGDEGGDPNGSVSLDPTLTQNGSTVAFVSAASNLIYGDANGFPDAFTASLQTPGGTAALPAGVNAGSGGFSLTAASSPELGVSVKRAKDGGVILLVETPGPGKLTAQARGSIPKAASTKKVSKKVAPGHKGTPAHASKAKPKSKKPSRKKKASSAVLFASATAAARSEGTTTLTLHLSAKYVADLQRAGKLGANVTIDFTPPAPAEALADEVAVTFVRATVAKASSGRAKGKGKKR
jgi:Tol biopolymer transport system component